MAMTSTDIVETPLEIKLLYGKVRKFPHQLADHTFSFHTFYTHVSHTNIKMIKKKTGGIFLVVYVLYGSLL